MQCQVEGVLWSQDSLGQLLLESPLSSTKPSCLPSPGPTFHGILILMIMLQ